MDDAHEPTKLFVGQIPKDMNEDILKQYFDEFGPISEVSMIRDNNSMISKGCAFVTFLYAQSAQLAISTMHDQVKLPNSHNLLQVRLAETHVERENKLFIGMLPKTVTEQVLHDMFHYYGELREVHIIRGPEGSPKGCAFVKYVDREAAIAAIEDLHDTIPMGATRPLVVKFADGKKNQGKNHDYWNAPHAAGNRSQQPPQMQDLQQQQQNQPRQVYSQYPLPINQLPHQQMVGMPFLQPNMSPIVTGNMLPPGSPIAPMSLPQHITIQQLPHQQLPHQMHQAPPQAPQRSMYTTSLPDDFFPPSPQGAASYAPDSPMSFAPPGMSREASKPSSFPMGPAGMIDAATAAQSNEAFGFQRDQQNRFSNYQPYNNQPQEPMHARPPEGPSGANLFIYHLPRDLTDADLATLFAPFGNVISAKVFVDRKTADSKGFGFVSYDTLASANAAIDSMNGFQIGSKRLKVQHKRVSSNAPGYQQQQFSNPGSNFSYGGAGSGPSLGPGPAHPNFHENYQYNRAPSSEDLTSAFSVMNLSGAPAATGSVGGLNIYSPRGAPPAPMAAQHFNLQQQQQQHYYIPAQNHVNREYESSDHFSGSAGPLCDHTLRSTDADNYTDRPENGASSAQEYRYDEAQTSVSNGSPTEQYEEA